MAEKPFVSVIIPCRNERRFVAACLDSVLQSDYPPERMEILIADGMSTDGTRETLAGYGPRIRVIDNVRRITPVALNLAIRQAKGDLILRVDAHARIPSDYISACVEASLTSGAENTGGVMVTLPQTPGIVGDAVVQTLSHRFGVGNSTFRTGAKEARFVDTVFGGCYRREVFDRIGLYNEDLPRSQDIEFNLRLKKAGGKTLLVPDIVSYYYARSQVLPFIRHNFINGIWAVLPFLHSDVVPVSWRHLIPLAFASALTFSLAAWAAHPLGKWLFAAVVVPYALVNVAVSARIALSRKDLRFALLMPGLFACLHLGYGFGSLWGVCLGALQLAHRAVSKFAGTPPVASAEGRKQS